MRIKGDGGEAGGLTGPSLPTVWTQLDSAHQEAIRPRGVHPSPTPLISPRLHPLGFCVCIAAPNEPMGEKEEYRMMLPREASV